MAKLTRTCFCYRIVRFFRVSGRRKIIQVGLTRAQAMDHCSRPDTSRAGVWFDGFEIMPGYADYTVAGVLPGAGDPAPDPAPAVDPVPLPVPAPVPVAGAPDPAPAVDPVFDCFEVMPVNDWIDLIAVMPYKWQPDPGRDRFAPAMPEDEGDYWD